MKYRNLFFHISSYFDLTFLKNSDSVETLLTFIILPYDVFTCVVTHLRAVFKLNGEPLCMNQLMLKTREFQLSIVWRCKSAVSRTNLAILRTTVPVTSTSLLRSSDTKMWNRIFWHFWFTEDFSTKGLKPSVKWDKILQNLPKCTKVSNFNS